MSRSTGNGLAGAGGLLCLFSLAMPWYVLHADGLAGGVGKTGVETLGGLSLLVAVLALIAGWSRSARVHPLLPTAAAGALALVVLVKVASPPSSAVALTGARSALSEALLSATGLHYAVTWGIWLAVIGALAALAGALAQSSRVSRGRERPRVARSRLS